MSEDFDHLCGFWFYGRPYVWFQGDTPETSGRLYLFHDTEKIYIHTRLGYYHRNDKLGPFSKEERSIPYSSYRYKTSMGIEKFNAISSIDAWANSFSSELCSWAVRYFGVFVSSRDGKLRDLDVRVNGKKIDASSDNVSDILEIYGIKSAGYNTNFIHPPNWLSSEEYHETQNYAQRVIQQKIVEEEFGFWEY